MPPTTYSDRSPPSVDIMLNESCVGRGCFLKFGEYVVRRIIDERCSYLLACCILLAAREACGICRL